MRLMGLVRLSDEVRFYRVIDEGMKEHEDR